MGTCVDCGDLVDKRELRNGRCPTHAQTDRRRRAAKRAKVEPWRRLYFTREWRRARAAALLRDGQRCRVTTDGDRCTETTDLSVHHDPPLEELYDQSRDWQEFLWLATRPEVLFSTCVRHNNALDALRRRMSRTSGPAA
jgi:hypothetical protein